jgi:hypothetical protein
MLARTIDHLWQSLGCFAIAWSLATMLRPNAAGIRVWVWRLAALKFVVPFGVLYAYGAWLGFPVRHNAIPPPVLLTDVGPSAQPFATPAQSFAANSVMLVIALLVTLVAAAGSLGWSLQQLRRAQLDRQTEESRNWDDQPPAAGFFKSAALTAAAILAVALPIVSGALHDRLWRQAALVIDTQSLRGATILMREAKPRLGALIQVDASDDHVLIRNINIKDLVALVYGVDQFEVFGGALPWMSSPSYDVNVTGPVHEPDAFDPYSLRQPMTEYLYEQFGVSIRINGACQEPCGRHVSIAIERLKY